MSGNYSFIGNETIIHEAPEWSVRALSTLAAELGKALRVATNPKSTAREVVSAHEQVATLVRMNTRDAPEPFRKQLLDVLNLKSGKGLTGLKRAAIISLSAALFLLTNYSSVKDNAAELLHDASELSALVIDAVGDLNDEAKILLREAFPDTPPEE